MSVLKCIVLPHDWNWLSEIRFELQKPDFEKVGIAPQFWGNKGHISSNSLSVAKPYELESCYGRNLEIENVIRVILSEIQFQYYQPLGQIKSFLISKFLQ